jgi:transcriptional adapter 3
LFYATDILRLVDQKRARELASPSSKKARNLGSGSTSSLSPPSVHSPPVAANGDDGEAAETPSSDSSEDSHEPEPAPTAPPSQVFGPDPLKFDDPTIYHIRDVTLGMADEEKMEIYSVARFPHSDLTHLMAGQPPDRDFSNSKPTNQVSANTFTTYIDPFVRPMTEEDIAFLKEKVWKLLR